MNVDKAALHVAPCNQMHGATPKTSHSCTEFENYEFPVSEGPAGKEQERLKQLSRARKRKKRLLKDIRKAVATADPERIKAARRSAMKSRQFLLISAVDAEKKKAVSKRHPLAELMGAAAKLSWYTACDEPVIVTPKAKSKGGYRVYGEFGIRFRTLHEGLRAIYSPSFMPKAFQYDAHGNGYDGVPKAIRDIRIAIGNGHVYVRTLDIEKFFPSFTRDGIVELCGLDDKIVTNCALGTHLKIVPRTSPIASLAEITYQARQGGPQGSAFSALLAQMIVSRLKWEGTTLLFNWVDNFLILGKTKDEVEAASIALISAIGGLPGGHFCFEASACRPSLRGGRMLGAPLADDGRQARH